MIDHLPFRSWCRYCVMFASRSDHHKDHNEVPAISCDYGILDSRDDDDRQQTEAEALAISATPILVIRDKRSKISMQIVYLAKGFVDQFPIDNNHVDFGTWLP